METSPKGNPRKLHPEFHNGTRSRGKLLPPTFKSHLISHYRVIGSGKYTLFSFGNRKVVERGKSKWMTEWFLNCERFTQKEHHKTLSFWSSCFLSPSSDLRHETSVLYILPGKFCSQTPFEKITELKQQSLHQKNNKWNQRDLSLNTSLGLFLPKSFEEFSTYIWRNISLSLTRQKKFKFRRINKNIKNK